MPAEPNPYPVEVPESVVAESPATAIFLRQVLDGLRRQHNTIQAGDTTYSYELLDEVTTEALHNLGSIGRFFHPDFGVTTARYVFFAAESDPNLQTWGLVRNASEWLVSNDLLRSNTKLFAGLTRTGDRANRYGWVVCGGFVPFDVKIVGNIQRLDSLTWVDGGLGAALADPIGTVVNLIPKADSYLGAGSIILAADQFGQADGASLNSILDRLEALDGLSRDATVAKGQSRKLSRMVGELKDELGQTNRAYELLVEQLGSVSPDEVIASMTTRLNAMANFANLSSDAATSALDAASRAHVKLSATVIASQTAKVWQDAAGRYAESSTSSANSAQLSANDSQVSADASATSASNAAVSETNAGTSASASQTSATNAATSAGAAAGSAGAAADSASSASTSASQASTSATNAAGSASSASTSAGTAASSATQAGNSATAAGNSASAAAGSASSASTSASQASTSASNAAGSASTASTQATLAANSSVAAANALAATFPKILDRNAITVEYNAFDTTATPFSGSISSGILYNASSSDGYGYGLFLRKYLPWTPGRKFAIHTSLRSVNSSPQNYLHWWYAGFDASNTLVEGGIFSSPVALSGSVLTDYVSPTITLNNPGTNPKYVRFGILYNRDGSTNPITNAIYLRELWVEDITESSAAASSASAAATSASSASTSATNAGTSATSASTSANTASTQAGNAAASASAAAGSAASASASASSAQTYQQLAASFGATSLIDNRNFNNWPNASLPPTGWQIDGSATGGTRVAGALSNSDYAWRLASSTTSYFFRYIGSTSLQSIRPGDWVVLEADIRLNAGELWPTSLWLNCYNSAGTFIDRVIVSVCNELDDTGKLIGAGVAGRRYRISKTIQIPPEFTDAFFGAFVVATNDGNIGGQGTSNNDVTVCSVDCRIGNKADIAGAKIEQLASAVADIRGNTASWRLGLNAGANTNAFIEAVARTDDPSTSPLTLVNNYGMAVPGAPRNQKIGARDAIKFYGTDGWNSAAYGAEGKDSNFYLAWTPVTLLAGTQVPSIAGLATDANKTTTTYEGLNYGLYPIYTGGAHRIYLYQLASGTEITPTGLKSINGLRCEIICVGGSLTFKVGGKQVGPTLSVGSTKFYPVIAGYSAGTGARDIVWADKAPTSASYIGLGASEVQILNPVGGSYVPALTVSNGDVVMTGNLQVGAKIKLGNGSTSWEVAIKPRLYTVTDGQAITWANLGYIPNYNFSPLGLAPLGSGETYSLYLDSISATGATVRLKINVPGTPASYTRTTDYVGGGGDPTRVIDRAGGSDSTTGNYDFVVDMALNGEAFYDGDSGSYMSNITAEALLYAKVSGTWVQVGRIDYNEWYNNGSAGGFTVIRRLTQTVAVPNGATHFGAATVSGASSYVYDFVSVSWSGTAGASGIRSASPAGETCGLTVIP